MLGWDVGGVNTKVARVEAAGVVAHAGVAPYELQRDPAALVPLLRRLAAAVGRTEGEPCAVTMTAELSQIFRTKREGVGFVLDAMEAAFPAAPVSVFAVDGGFVTPAEARRHPLAVAAANWAATAHVVAAMHPDVLLIDVGTTTTDIIPIAHGRVAAHGLTDPDRLACGELVYSGAVRTPVEAIVSQVPYGNGTAGVSAEGFALAGDVHVWRRALEPAGYTAPTPDGRPVTRECCGERLARVICADREMLGETAVDGIAAAVAEAQVARIHQAIEQVASRHRGIKTAVVAGAGGFIATAAACRAGLDVIDLASTLGANASRCAPAAAVALLAHARAQGGAWPGSADGERRLHV